MLKYSIVITAHNEEKSIEKLVTSIINVFPHGQLYEIYVAEDGSTDKTRAVIHNLVDKFETKITLSPESSRLGYSKAIINAINHANGEWLLFLDGDGQTSPEDAIKLIDYARDGVVVIGVRVHRADSFARKLASRAFGFLYLLLGFPNLKDPSSGTILVKRSEVEEFASKKIRLKFGLWWEFQAWAKYANLNTVEIPIEHKNREFGKTQVYVGWRTLVIGISHAFGLFLLRSDLRKTRLKG